MAEHRTFQAFFSYAHHDAETDQRLVEALTIELERRVASRLVNDSFVIWRDVKGIRTANFWNPTIEDALQSSDLMIILLTPRWITSDYCRKEYAIFREIESSEGTTSLVAPISERRPAAEPKNGARPVLAFRGPPEATAIAVKGSARFGSG
jgi:hypothetical protein